MNGDLRLAAKWSVFEDRAHVHVSIEKVYALLRMQPMKGDFEVGFVVTLCPIEGSTNRDPRVCR